MERGDAAAPGEAVGKGQPEKKRYSATERPRDTRDTGSGVPSPPHHRRITTRLCHPRPRPAQRCSPRDGRRAPAVGMLAPSGGTRGRGASRALTPPRAQDALPSTHLHSPSEGETEARTGAWGGTGAGRSRETASRKRAPAPQAAAAGRPGPSLLCPPLLGLPLPSPARPSPAAGGTQIGRCRERGSPRATPLCAAADVEPGGLEQRDERHSATPAGFFFCILG